LLYYDRAVLLWLTCATQRTPYRYYRCSGHGETLMLSWHAQPSLLVMRSPLPLLVTVVRGGPFAHSIIGIARVQLKPHGMVAWSIEHGVTATACDMLRCMFTKTRYPGMPCAPAQDVHEVLCSVVWRVELLRCDYVLHVHLCQSRIGGQSKVFSSATRAAEEARNVMLNGHHCSDTE
jgi:hypothetical protein